MTFPGAGAQVYYNEAGEPLGWDYPGVDDGPDPDDFDDYEEEDEEDEEEAYVCDVDGEEFDSLNKLDEHIEHEHAGDDEEWDDEGDEPDIHDPAHEQSAPPAA